MAERIYNRSKTGSLDSLDEEPFATENELQELLAEHPELLDGEQVRPGDPRRWLLIKREKGIAESSDTSSRWSLDHLIVDQDAVPTLVEVKRGSNSEIRRTIVGQMLEYAANAARTWTGDELRQTFEATAAADGLDPDEELGRPLQMDGEQFRGESTQTLVPRVLGRVSNAPTRRSSGSRQRLTREAFLDDFTDEEERHAAQCLLDVAQDSGAAFDWGASRVSVCIRCSLWLRPVAVAWFHPPSTTDKGWILTGKGWIKARAFTFGAAILDYAPAPDRRELSTVLEQWANLFGKDSFTNASSKG